jgi:hypothetical protein
LAAHQHEAFDRLAALLHPDGMLVGAGGDVSAAAHQGLKRLRSALKVVDLDVEAGILEEALPLRDGERQIIQRRLTADRQHHLGLLRLAGLRPRDVGRRD